METENRPTFALFAVWRLIAAMMVMFYHFLSFGPSEYEIFENSGRAFGPLLDMFFIISGFLIWTHYAQKLITGTDYVNFVIRRFARIYPLHIATLAVFCVAWALTVVMQMDTTLTEGYSVVELLKQLLLINAWGGSEYLTFNFVSWSLSAEWFCYLAFPLLVLSFRNAGLVGLILLLIASVGVLEGFTYLKIIPFPTWLEANTWGAYRVFADFVLGAVIANVAARKVLSITSHWYAWGALGFALSVMATNPSWGYWSMICITIALFIAAQVEINAPGKSAYLKPLLPVSFVSFGIYMWHPVFAIGLLGLGWKHIVEPMGYGGFPVFFVLAVIGSVATAFASALLFEAPVRKAILRFANKHQPDLGEATISLQNAEKRLLPNNR